MGGVKARIREDDDLPVEPAVLPLSDAKASPLESAPEISGNERKAVPRDAQTAYPKVASSPTQLGEMGIRFDFNLGARITLPPRTGDKEWCIRLFDQDTGNLLFESRNKGAFVSSSKRFFVRFRIDVFEDGERVFEHVYDCKDREVLVQFPVGTLGDTLAWFPYAARFQEIHQCRMTCAMSELIIPLLKDGYPKIKFVTHEDVVDQGLADSFYATYCLGLFFDDGDNIWQPTDFRLVGLHRTAAYILGVSPEESALKIEVEDQSRPIEDPYVCIAVQSSSGCKLWNNPFGWRDIVAGLKAKGLRVICIDQKPVHGSGLLYTHIPYGAEDETGDRPLTERARWLKHAEIFVGLSSGLSWLAHGCGTPTVLVSGFTHPTNEFTTPYRVINWHTCNSCWNDPALRFKHDDFLWCPRHKDTPRQFECTRLITSAQVMMQVERALADVDARRAHVEARTPAAMRTV